MVLSFIEQQLFKKLQDTKKLNVQLINEFERVYGILFFKAMEYLNEEKLITKHIFSPSNLIIWTIRSFKGEYLVYPEIFCSCHAFLIDSIYRSQSFKFCKHLLAYSICEILGLFGIKNHQDSEYKELILSLKL